MEAGQDCNPVISQIVLAEIAFCDNLTAKRAQVVNQQDHAQAARLLRDVLGNLLPDGPERRYRRILSFKDEVQYGTRQATRDEAGRLLADLKELVRWAQELLSTGMASNRKWLALSAANFGLLAGGNRSVRALMGAREVKTASQQSSQHL